MHNLFDRIAPARALGIRVNAFQDGHVVLTAPFGPNRNDKGTAFAGSIASLLSLAGWAAITLSLREAGTGADVMIVQSEISYSAPARAALFAEAGISSDESARVIRELETRGRSRITLRAAVHSEGTDCAAMTASYAVQSKTP